MSMRCRMYAPIASAAVTSTSRAYGKSSGSRSNDFDGCTRVKKRSRPCDSVRVVDSRFAGNVTMPALRRVYT